MLSTNPTAFAACASRAHFNSYRIYTFAIHTCTRIILSRSHDLEFLRHADRDPKTSLLQLLAYSKREFLLARKFYNVFAS